MKFHVLPVIQTRPAHVFVIEGKSEWLDQVQRRFRGQREPTCRPRIVRNFWFEQNNVKHKFGFRSGPCGAPV